MPDFRTPVLGLGAAAGLVLASAAITIAAVLIAGIWWGWALIVPIGVLAILVGTYKVADWRRVRRVRRQLRAQP